MQISVTVQHILEVPNCSSVLGIIPALVEFAKKQPKGVVVSTQFNGMPLHLCASDSVDTILAHYFASARGRFVPRIPVPRTKIGHRV